MKLHEYKSKQIFADYGIPIPKGEVATTPAEARAIAERLGKTVVIKSQVLVGGRGKAGGIKLAKTPDEAEEVASQILGMDIKGLTVNKVLVDEAADIKSEIYLAVVLDRTARKIAVMASTEGGVEIEVVAAETPEKIVTIHADPFDGLSDADVYNLAHSIGLPEEHVAAFVEIAQGLYRTFVENDAELAEINPLVINGAGELQAVDGKIVLDDSGLFRHPELAEMRDPQEENEAERQAREAGLSFIKLDGKIGCMVNGAGLAMTTMDLVHLFGSSPANFLDIGGGAQADKVETALRIILSDENVDAVLINIFGGITRCDEVAKGLVSSLGTLNTEVPFVVRLVGTNEEEGRQILTESGFDITPATSLADAAQKAVDAAKKKGEAA